MKEERKGREYRRKQIIAQMAELELKHKAEIGALAQELIALDEEKCSGDSREQGEVTPHETRRLYALRSNRVPMQAKKAEWAMWRRLREMGLVSIHQQISSIRDSYSLYVSLTDEGRRWVANHWGP